MCRGVAGVLHARRSCGSVGCDGRKPRAAAPGRRQSSRTPPILHAKRARPARQRGFLQLTRCKLYHRPVNRGDARDGGGRPARAPTSARAPLAPAVLAGCAREGDQGPLAAHVNMMLNVLGDACRLQDAGSDVWTRRLRKLGARFCRGASWHASLCPSLYRGPSGGPFTRASVWCTCGRRCVVVTSECTRCLYVICVYVQPLVP